jgi:serine/threonine-protein kinase
MQTLPAPRELVLEQLERMLASETFAGAERSRALLRFLVEHVVGNQSGRLKEYTIGSEALGRGDTFDPRTDPIVRAEASRLRNRIERYYATNGVTDTVLITLPKGSYVPQLQTRAIPEAAPVAGTPRSTPGRLQRLIWFALGGITVGAAVTFFVWTRDRQPPAAESGQIEIIDLDLGAADRSLGSDWGNDVILSPNGTRIVFVARGSDHVVRLMTMMVGQPRTVVALPDTDGARAPFFSPDGRWVGFWADAKVKTISVDGGSPVVLTGAASFGGASWGEDNYIIAAIDEVLTRVSWTSRESTVVADLRKERVIPLWPDLLPGARHVLFTAVAPQGPDAANIEVLSLSNGTRTPLVRAATFGRYLRDGYLLYVNQGTLFAVSFDPQQLAVRGTGVPVLEERVAYSSIFGFAQFDVSRNGRLIYRRRPPFVASWLDRAGGIEPLLSRAGPYTFPRLSADGQRLAINVIDSGVGRIDMYDRRLEQPTRLPFAPGSMSPVWHPDGFLVVGSRAGMSWMKTDDLSNVETLTRASNVQIPWSFTADGTRLAYLEQSATSGLDLWTVPVRHSAGKLTAGDPKPFKQTPYFEGAPSFSPDGRWLLYGWGPKGIWNVYVQPFPPDSSKEINVSKTGGRIARWLPNGREIVYRTDDQRLMVVEYEVKNGTFTVSTPKEWTPVRLADTGVIDNFDIHGDRILGLVPAAREDEQRIKNSATVMLRFSDEVPRRLSPRK